jgi:prolyl oligopeptidase
VNQKLFYHKMGTTQEEDVLLFAMPEEPKWNSSAVVTDDGRWLWLSIGSGCEPVNKVYVCDLSSLPKAADGSVDFSKVAYADCKPQLPFVKLANTFVAGWTLIASEGSILTIGTTFKAPRERLVALNMANATEGALTAGRFREIIPQHSKDLLQGVVPLKGDLMVVQWMRDVVDIAELRRLSDGSLLATVPLPSLGTMSSVKTEPNRASTEFWFSLTSFVEASTQYRADAATIIEAANLSGNATEDCPGVQVFKRAELKVEHDPASYVTKQVFVKSKDGTQVPMFIVHHKSVKLDGENATLLYGYGGFNISLQPTFSAARCGLLFDMQGSLLW